MTSAEAAAKYVPLFSALGLLTEDMTPFDIFMKALPLMSVVLAVRYDCDPWQAEIEHYRAGDTAVVNYDVDDALELLEGFTKEQKAAVVDRFNKAS